MLLAILACQEVFEAPERIGSQGILVVDGVIGSGSEKSVLKISRTASLSTRTVFKETGATVQLESAAGQVFNFTEDREGEYTFDSPGLRNGELYFLKIKTKNGQDYLSDSLKVLRTPTIDSLYWFRTSDGVNIELATNNQLVNSSNNYLWKFTQTWEAYAENKTFLQTEESTNQRGQKTYRVVYLQENERPYFDSLKYYCWQQEISSELLINTSRQLAENKVVQPISFIENTSPKFKNKWSIEVEQMAISEEAFEYFNLIKKNTELTGSIFAPQPSILYGNIHSTSNPEELVIGFAVLSDIKKRRIFIERSELPGWEPFTACQPTLFANNSNTIRDQVRPSFLPVFVPADAAPFPQVPVFIADILPCADCRINGFNKKPDFWPKPSD